MIIGILILVTVLIFFFVIGILFSNGKGAFLVAGFNTMPKEEKEKYDTVALCKFMGKLMFALCFSMIFWLLAIIYNMDSLFIIGFILFMVCIFVSLIYMNTENRFMKKDN